MSIILPTYATNYDLIPIKNEEQAMKYNFSFDARNKKNIEYIIYWGLPIYPILAERYGIMETGFFFDAAFIDTVGNYQTSSLNTKYAWDAIASFDLNGRKSAKETIFNQPIHKQSKFNAGHFEKEKPELKNLEWKGVVLAMQNPTDRAIQSVTTPEKYFQFVDECCSFYGSNLFVKMHPWNSGETYNKIAEIATRHKCSYGKAPISLIDKCEFVIAYNSTFAIDCLLRDVPYIQYGMGTFFNTFGVQYSAQSLPFSVKNIENASKLCDFLIYKYCYKKSMSADKFAAMINIFSSSRDMFPMPEQHCYAINILD